MITTFYINRIMKDMQSNAIRTLEQKGYVPPMLIIVSDSLCNFNYLYDLYENILDITYDEWLNGLKITTFHLRIRDDHDIDLQIELSKYVASNYIPLAIGFIGQAYYKSMTYNEYNNLKIGSLNLDHESIKILLTRFYIKDNENDFIQMNPFYMTEKKSEFDFGLNDGMDRTVNIMPSPWTINPSNYLAKENVNPYTT